MFSIRMILHYKLWNSEILCMLVAPSVELRMPVLSTVRMKLSPESNAVFAYGIGAASRTLKAGLGWRCPRLKKAGISSIHSSHLAKLWEFSVN